HWLAGVAAEVDELGLDEAALEPRTRTVIAKGRRRRPDPAVARAWCERVLGWFGGYDVLLTPVVARPAPLAGKAAGMGYLAAYLNGARTVPYTPAWNLAGLPALALPVPGAGLAGAVQLVAPSEGPVFALAAQLEAAL